jgi:hypothetical protein
VDENETRDNSLCVKMWYLLEGKGRLHELGRIVATVEYSRLEVE